MQEQTRQPVGVPLLAIPALQKTRGPPRGRSAERLVRETVTELGFNAPGHLCPLSKELLLANDHPQEMLLIQTYKCGRGIPGRENSSQHPELCSRKVSSNQSRYREFK